MSNALGIDLTGKIVIFKQDYLAVIANEHPYYCDGGFGCHPATSGSRLAGVWLSDGERGAMTGGDVERIIDESELTDEQMQRLNAARST